MGKCLKDVESFQYILLFSLFFLFHILSCSQNWLAVKWRTVKSRTIKAATVEKLVEHLPTVIEEMDSLYLHTFFNTYLTFTNLQYVLKLLMHR